MPRLSSIVQNKIDRIDLLSAKTDELQCLKNMKSYMKISFSPYEPYFKEWIKVDEVLIDGKKATFNVKTENGKITYQLRGTSPNRYELRLKKERYLDVVFDMRSKVLENISNLEDLWLGNINMLSKHQQLKMRFTWGSIPLDLDAHIFCFDESLKNKEHVYFLNMKSDESLIDIDVDDVTSYGPEHIQILQPKENNWYLLAIHNYSKFVKNDDDSYDMDYEKLVNVNVSLYDFVLNIKPAVDLKGRYWWDVLLLHNDKIYVLNEAPDDRTVDYSHELDVFAKRKLLRLASQCEEVYDISSYKPTTLRWF